MRGVSVLARLAGGDLVRYTTHRVQPPTPFERPPLKPQVPLPRPHPPRPALPRPVPPCPLVRYTEAKARAILYGMQPPGVSLPYVDSKFGAFLAGKALYNVSGSDADGASFAPAG